jgi:predicted transcriptional regulator
MIGPDKIRTKAIAMPSVAKIFGTTLRRIRTQSGITQKELGAITGMSHILIGEMERGLKAPNLTSSSPSQMPRSRDRYR